MRHWKMFADSRPETAIFLLRDMPNQRHDYNSMDDDCI